jgi:hypothetical protein
VDGIEKVPPERVECEHGRLKRKCEICELTEELAQAIFERDSETRWASQYKQERDEAREALREMLDLFVYGRCHVQADPCMTREDRWRKAAGLEDKNDR